MRIPLIELLWWEGCPSTDGARAAVRAALDDVGLAGVEVQMREIETEEQAGDAEFRGSPTILIDGADAFPTPGSEPPGLSCRVYRRRDGRVSPIPDPDDLREALRLAAERVEVS